MTKEQALQTLANYAKQVPTLAIAYCAHRPEFTQNLAAQTQECLKQHIEIESAIKAIQQSWTVSNPNKTEPQNP